MKLPVEQILKVNRLSLTNGRRNVLQLFLQSDYALVHAEIERELHNIIDRVTIYRTLKTFLKKGIIHLIPTTDGSLKYALSKDDLQQEHVHFACKKCNKTICFDNFTIPKIKLPLEYKQEVCEIIISGLCRECKSGNKKGNYE